MVRLASNINHAVVWGDLHLYQEAAFSDCPHVEILASIFDDHEDILRFLDDSSGGSAAGLNEDGRRQKENRLRELAQAVHEAACGLKDNATEEVWLERCYRPLIVQGAHGHSLW